MKIVILLFDNFTALDVVGPYEVLSRMPGATVYITGIEKRNYRDEKGLQLVAQFSINEITNADILLVPGGFGIDHILDNKAVIDWVKKIDLTTKWTTSVCSGALLLARAGLLTGKNCTTHWLRKDQLRKFDVTVLDERYVQDGKIITSAGVSAGIDMALYLLSKIAGEQTAQLIQLSIEYDPKPPFDSGSPDKAPKELLDRLKSRIKQ